MTTATIETRTAEILNALETLRPYVSALEKNNFLFPDVLKGCYIASPASVQHAIYASSRRLTLEKLARFFAIVYTQEDVHAFLAAYEAAAPACYDQEADLETSAPWCCPWLTGAMGASKGDTPETLGRKAACMDYSELETLFGTAGADGLAARTEAAIRGYLLRGAPIPEFLKPEEDILRRAAAEIAAVEDSTDEDDEAERLISEIVSQCIAEVTTSVAMRKAAR